jgi:hypothetical protein
MPDVLVAATALSLLFAVLMTVIAAKLLRESRVRTSSRVEALQALAAGAPATQAPTVAPPALVAPAVQPVLTAPVPAPTLPRPVTFAPPIAPQQDDEWDFALHDERLDLPVPARRLGDVPVFHRPANERQEDVAAPTFLQKAGPAPFSSSVPDHDLFEAAIPPTPSRRWTWVAAVALVMTLGGGTFYLISSGVVARAIATHDANVTNAAALPIELLSLRYATDGGNFVVTGLVQNPAKSVSLHGVQAVVYLFDAQGKFIASARASLEADVLSPGGESSFVVRVPAGTEVTKYRVSFQHDDGAAVQHVDRRGTMPENTTGDAVQPAPATAPVITARKNG